MSDPPAYLSYRVSRTHPFCTTGRQIIAPRVSALTQAEQSRVPAGLVAMLDRFAEVVSQAPPPLRWLANAVSGLQPVLECSRIDDREYWSIRLAHPFLDRLLGECFGFDAQPPDISGSDVPSVLAWLGNTFGIIDLGAEQGSLAPFGRTLVEVMALERSSLEIAELELEGSGISLDDRWTTLRAELPPEADHWVSLYETDGDWLFADVENDQTLWIGAEWTGEPVIRFALPWARATSFVVWRLLDGRPVRPLDLEMLGAKPGG